MKTYKDGFALAGAKIHKKKQTASCFAAFFFMRLFFSCFFHRDTHIEYYYQRGTAIAIEVKKMVMGRLSLPWSDGTEVMGQPDEQARLLPHHFSPTPLVSSLLMTKIAVA